MTRFIGTLEAGLIKFTPKDIITISPENLLKIDKSLDSANFYLNGQSSSYSEVNALRCEKFIKASIMEDSRGKMHILVQAKKE
jgi:hypothetical protein